MFLKRLQKRFQISELAQAVLPHHFPKLARMTEREFQAESEGGTVVLDTRHSVAFAEGHFPGWEARNPRRPLSRRMEIERNSRVEEYPACAAYVASFRVVFCKAFGRCLPERLPERGSIKLAASARLRQRSIFARWNGCFLWQRAFERMRR
jgi:hypothetical protein